MKVDEECWEESISIDFDLALIGTENFEALFRV